MGPLDFDGGWIETKLPQLASSNVAISHKPWACQRQYHGRKEPPWQGFLTVVSAGRSSIKPAWTTWGQRDSSSQPSDLESDALPLRHSPLVAGLRMMVPVPCQCKARINLWLQISWLVLFWACVVHWVCKNTKLFQRLVDSSAFFWLWSWKVFLRTCMIWLFVRLATSLKYVLPFCHWTCLYFWVDSTFYWPSYRSQGGSSSRPWG